MYCGRYEVDYCGFMRTRWMDATELFVMTKLNLPDGEAHLGGTELK